MVKYRPHCFCCANQVLMLTSWHLNEKTQRGLYQSKAVSSFACIGRRCLLRLLNHQISIIVPYWTTCALTQAILQEEHLYVKLQINNLSLRLPFKENDVCTGLISIIADSCLVEEFSKPKGLNRKESRLYTAVTAV